MRVIPMHPPQFRFNLPKQLEEIAEIKNGIALATVHRQR
jgi:hypothetical protein